MFFHRAHDRPRNHHGRGWSLLAVCLFQRLACLLNRIPSRVDLEMAGITRFSFRVMVGESGRLDCTVAAACRPLSLGSAADTAASTVSRAADSFAAVSTVPRTLTRW